MELPKCIKDLFKSTSLTINNLNLGENIWVVYAHGKFSKIKKLTTKSLCAFEQFTSNGTMYLTIFLISEDEYKTSHHICIEDINLNQKAKYRYTNHFAFSSKAEALYYKELCIEFNIQSEYVLQQIDSKTIL